MGGPGRANHWLQGAASLPLGLKLLAIPRTEIPQGCDGPVGHVASGHRRAVRGCRVPGAVAVCGKAARRGSGFRKRGDLLPQEEVLAAKESPH